MAATLCEFGRPERSPGRLGLVEFGDDADTGIMLTGVPVDRAALMIEHGCTHADLELDRMIWAAAYVSAFERTIYAPSPEGRRCLREPKLEPAERARFAGLEADAVVLARWKAKGQP